VGLITKITMNLLWQGRRPSNEHQIGELACRLGRSPKVAT
jgi:hypothetical protein